MTIRHGLFTINSEGCAGHHALGGTEVLRARVGKLNELYRVYQLTQASLEQNQSDLVSLTASVQKKIDFASKQLRKVERMLNPLRAHDTFRQGLDLAFGEHTTMISPAVAAGHLMNSPHVLTAVGAGAGVTAMAGSWGTVQLIAHASTGAAMGGLHGAAAANAGWAWFGGGSLATHGGGMALGHAVLPGIGSAIAVAVSAIMSYTQANKVATLCREVESANSKNALILSKAESALTSLEILKTRFSEQNDLLFKAVAEARRVLFPFGWLSHVFRLVRFWLKKHYYNADEFIYVEQLSEAVTTYLRNMK